MCDQLRDILLIGWWRGNHVVLWEPCDSSQNGLRQCWTLSPDMPCSGCLWDTQVERIKWLPGTREAVMLEFGGMEQDARRDLVYQFFC